eukprot:508286_1
MSTYNTFHTDHRFIHLSQMQPKQYNYTHMQPEHSHRIDLQLATVTQNQQYLNQQIYQQLNRLQQTHQQQLQQFQQQIHQTYQQTPQPHTTQSPQIVNQHISYAQPIANQYQSVYTNPMYNTYTYHSYQQISDPNMNTHRNEYQAITQNNQSHNNQINPSITYQSANISNNYNNQHTNNLNHTTQTVNNNLIVQDNTFVNSDVHSDKDQTCSLSHEYDEHKNDNIDLFATDYFDVTNSTDLFQVSNNIKYTKFITPITSHPSNCCGNVIIDSMNPHIYQWKFIVRGENMQSKAVTIGIYGHNRNVNPSEYFYKTSFGSFYRDPNGKSVGFGYHIGQDFVPTNSPHIYQAYREYTEYRKCRINSGDMITMTLDLFDKHISYKHNNNNLGIAFQNIDIKPDLFYRMAVKFGKKCEGYSIEIEDFKIIEEVKLLKDRIKELERENERMRKRMKLIVGDNEMLVNIYDMSEKIDKITNDNKNLYDSCQAMQQVITNNEKENECVACMDLRRSYICLPCAHLCLCKNCAKEMKNVCPLCQRKCKKIVKVFR